MDGIVKETKFVDKILNVPYSSQYLDIEEKQHLLTACGMACVHMALRHFGVDGQSLDKLVGEGVSNGGYGKSGWIHNYLVRVFREHGIDCGRKEQMHDRDVEEFRNSLRDGNPIIISMQRFSFDRRIFHMVIIIGYREDLSGKLEGFFYHDPAGLNPEEVTNLFVSVPVFLQYWRRMALFPKGNSL